VAETIAWLQTFAFLRCTPHLLPLPLPQDHGWLPAIFDCLFVFVVLALTKQALILQFNTLLRKLRFTFIERKMRNDHISPLPTPHALKLNLYHLDRGENLKISDFKIP